MPRGSLLDIWHHPRARPLRFAVVGGAATVTHLAVAGVALALWPAMSPYVANLAAFLVAVAVSFYGHRHLTFRTSGSAWRFFAIAVAGFAVNNVILTLGLHWGVPKYIAIAIATVCVPILTYIASALWAFRSTP